MLQGTNYHRFHPAYMKLLNGDKCMLGPSGSSTSSRYPPSELEAKRVAEGFPGRPKRAVEGELVQRIEGKEIVEKIGRQLSEAELDELMKHLGAVKVAIPELVLKQDVCELAAIKEQWKAIHAVVTSPDGRPVSVDALEMAHNRNGRLTGSE